MKNVIANDALLLVMASCVTSKKGVQRLTFAQNPVVAHRGAFKSKNCLKTLSRHCRKQSGCGVPVQSLMFACPLVTHLL